MFGSLVTLLLMKKISKKYYNNADSPANLQNVQYVPIYSVGMEHTIIWY